LTVVDRAAIAPRWGTPAAGYDTRDGSTVRRANHRWPGISRLSVVSSSRPDNLRTYVRFATRAWLGSW
jgi:hypothetical protein